MAARPQIPFVLFKEDRARLLQFQEELKARTGLNMTLGGTLRLVIRLCPLDETLNVKTLELLEDDRRGDWRKGHKKRLYRLSSMITPQEKEKLDLILRHISPVLRPKLKKSALARLILRMMPKSLNMFDAARDVFFDDLRRRMTIA